MDSNKRLAAVIAWTVVQIRIGWTEVGCVSYHRNRCTWSWVEDTALAV